MKITKSDKKSVGDNPTSKTKSTKKSNKSEADGKKNTSKSEKAGLVFPVGRVNRVARSSSNAKRVGASAPVYMTAVLEYLTEEIADQAGLNTMCEGRKKITPNDVTVGIRSDPELSKLFAGCGTSFGKKMTNVTQAITYMPATKAKESAEK